MRRIILALMLIVLLMCLQASAALAQEDVLDLRGMSFSSAGEISALIDARPETTAVDLTGAPLPLNVCREIITQYPDIRFIYTLSLFGLEVSSEAESVDFAGCDVNDTERLIAGIDCLPNLREVLLYRNFVSKENKELLFARYPDIFFGFTIKLENRRYEIRTDMTAFSTLKNGAPPYFYDDDLWWVKMCPNLLALDLGHNIITDLSFLYDAPQLKILIVACNAIEDITPIASLKNLEYLEVFKNGVVDVSPLAGLDKLIDLNLCVNKIEDVSPLFHMQHLERLWLSHNKGITDEHRQEIIDAFPNTEVVFSSQGSTGLILLPNGGDLPGWRDHPRYDVIYRIFHKNEYEPWIKETE